MIRAATEADTSAILDVINDAAQRYRGVIPEDLYHEPYMTEQALRAEMADGVEFSVLELPSGIVAVMGVQQRDGARLIRHSYVARTAQSQGFGSALLKSYLRTFGSTPLLVGCLSSMTWAVAFYQQHGFQIVPADQILPLRKRYWTLPDAHIRRGVVLANHAWRAQQDIHQDSSAHGNANLTDTGSKRAELAIQYLQVLYNQIIDHKNVRDRWFRYYLLVISVPFGLLAAGLQSGTWQRIAVYPNRLLWLFSMLLLSIGVLFFMLYIRQRINYLSVYERALRIEREVVQPAIDQAARSRKASEMGQFSADFYANGVHILLNSVWSVLAWIFGALALRELEVHAWLWTGGLSTMLLSAATHIAVRDRALRAADEGLKSASSG